MVLPSGLNLPDTEIAQFCEKWGISKLEVFGSATTRNFKPESDVDLLATFAPESKPGLEFFGAASELSALLRRKVDLLTKKGLENSRNKFRSKKIFESALQVYDRT
jgi:predicted nucleotidyltransferase